MGTLSKSFQWFQPGQPLPEFMKRRGIYDHIKFIMRQCYHRAVADATQLNKYQPGTPAVYGETSFDFVQQLMQKVHLTSEDNFIDLGSGKLRRALKRVHVVTIISNCLKSCDKCFSKNV